MKTIKEWFEDLPKEVREKAIANTNDNLLGSRVENLKKALSGAFQWHLSPEGQNYWINIIESL
jgi:hypothetical protein